MADLMSMLEGCNPYIGIYHTAHERLREMDTSSPHAGAALTANLQLILDDGHDQRRYNLPTAAQVAMIMPDNDSYKPPRPVKMSLRSSTANTSHHTVYHTHPSYVPLHYVLLFPHGTRGWSYDLRLANTRGLRQRTGLTQSHYYRFYLFSRPGQFNVLHFAGRLFQQFIVEAYANIENSRLFYLENNQDSLRAELYNGLQDAVHAHDLPNDLPNPFSRPIGRKIILPVTHSHSPRQYTLLCQNAMALCQHYGKPTLFTTFTANPKWPEIQGQLISGQQPNDRPDIIATVFHLKLKALLKDIKTGCFGPLLAHVYTIEYQKRGLPHRHLVLRLQNRHQFLSPETVDEIVSAQIPNADADPSLRHTITTAMVHGPCGVDYPDAPCMVEDSRTGLSKCSKSFPKVFCDETTIPESEYPHYARPTNGPTFDKDLSGGRQFRVTNEWIVPYNPFLSYRYDAHINVEICASFDAIKYLFKYVFKGSDRAVYEIQGGNEIAEFKEGRYISPVKAAWDIMEYKFHDQSPSLQPLPFHLEGEHQVYWAEDATNEEIMQQMTQAQSKLMAFFAYYASNPDSTKYLYIEFPRYFIWRDGQWFPRKQGEQLGRLYVCTPHHSERFYLRMLLMTVRGPSSYQYLRTVHGITHDTQREACVALSLIGDGGEWVHAFRDSMQISSGHSLRNLFATAIVFGNVPNPRGLWHQFREYNCDDLTHKLRQMNCNPEEGDQYDYGLYVIKRVVEDEYNQSYQGFQLPLPQIDWTFTDADGFAANFAAENAGAQDDVNVDDLNAEQSQCFDLVIANVINENGAGQYFLQGSGDTGKTFLYRCSYKYLSERSYTVLCVASSGIAATLLPFGQTAHSKFGIPIDLNADSTSRISKQSAQGRLLAAADLIIWDEVPMQHKYCFEVLDKLLRDLRWNNSLFGGVSVVLGGDFAQILPVVRGDNFWPR